MKAQKSRVNTHKSGFVAVMGRPNVGKSTLMNALLGQKVAAVSPRPQTTRKRQLGILTLETAQIVFVDTPGVHKPVHKLGEAMNKEAEETLQGCEVILFLVDVSQPPQPEDRLLSDLFRELPQSNKVILALNKADLAAPEQLLLHRQAYCDLAPAATPVAVSATTEDNLDQLLELVLERLPAGDPYYASDQITDLSEREITADLIREAALIILRDEVPHGIAIRIDQYKERNEHGAYIEATLFVERESHKPIVIGQAGKMLKAIGSLAREKIEQMTGRKVYLLLRVKVRKNWRDDKKVLRWFGYE
jgi:GTP-binding protein Era